jgi:hypothetical protein
MERQTTRPDGSGRSGGTGEGFPGAGDALGGDWTRYEESGPPPRRPAAFDPAALFVLLDGMRRVVPRELEEQLTNLIREFLLTLRSLIDWYLERLDRPHRGPEVEDIPIE